MSTPSHVIDHENQSAARDEVRRKFGEEVKKIVGNGELHLRAMRKDVVFKSSADATAIRSGAPAGARIEGSRLVSVPAAALPERSLGGDPLQVTAAKTGLPQIVDSTGQSWGVFANESLARQTAGSFAS